jgi:hypothetical protein
MKTIMVIIALFCQGMTGFAQDVCHLENPDSLRILNFPIIHSEYATVVIYGGTRSSAIWFSLYEDYCCENFLYQSFTDTFVVTGLQSGILWARIESLCDTSRAVGSDIDVEFISHAPTIKNISGATSGSCYDVLGRFMFSWDNPSSFHDQFQLLGYGCYIVHTNNSMRKVCKL